MVKTWALVLLLPSVLLGGVPTVDRPVVDTSGLLSPSDRDAVASELVRLREETGAQMAVVVVRTTHGEPIEDYALRTAEAWRGGGAGQDNGLLFVLAVDDRRQRLEVGYGLEEHLPDTTVRTLLEAQGPLLRQGNYREAVLGVVGGVRARLPGAEGVVTFQEPWSAQDVGVAFLWVLGSGLLAGVLLGFCVGMWMEQLGAVRLAGAVGAILGVPLAAIALCVHPSQLPTAHFLLAFAAFTLMFSLATLVSINSSLPFGILMGAGTFMGGWIAGTTTPPADVLELLLEAGIVAGAGIVFLAVLAAFLWSVSNGRSSTTYRGNGSSGSWGSSSSSWGSSSSSSSSSSDSSSSSTSWGGGGGSFGGGGASSSW